MSTITDNQRASNQTQANDALHRLVPAMARLCEPQKAAMLAMLAAAADICVDITLLGLEGDDVECARILDGHLARGLNTNEWNLGGGRGVFRVEMLPNEGTRR